MQSGELVELAALLATHGPELIHTRSRLSERSIQRYWTCSRCRIDRWSRSLRRFTRFTERSPCPLHRNDMIWLRVRGELEEILTSEILTRVWTAISKATDVVRGHSELESTARSIMISHLEVRHRALRLLIDPMAMEPSEAEWLNLLRRRSERWTDLLIGRMLSPDLVDIREVACNPVRAVEFAEDLGIDNESTVNDLAWPMMVTSLKSAFEKTRETPCPNPDLNAKIVTSILACYPPDMFDSVGLVTSLWQVRLVNAADDATMMIDKLLRNE